jgi:hypothetical protein
MEIQIMANAIVTQLIATSEQDRSNLIETRADMAKAVLDVLLAAMQSDDPILPDLVERTISAVSELLSVP